jgi:hypothetical protein
MSRSLCVAALLSMVLHLVGFFVADGIWLRDVETEVFRARLLLPPRFVQPPRPVLPRPDMPRIEMEHLPSTAMATNVAELALPGATIGAVQGAGIPLPGAGADELSQPKAAGPELAREKMPSPVGQVYVDSLESEAMELIDMEALARADRFRAVVIPNPHSRQDIRGFINFTSLSLDGVGSFALGGKPVLADLARYSRDYTQILARVRGRTVRDFRSKELLKDPIHFMFPIEQRGGSSQRIYLREDEIDLLSGYLRQGGFLFIDAGASADDRWFLREMVACLRRALGADGRLLKIPAQHPLYHSFYSYEDGFPGEERMEAMEGWGNRWYFPDRVPCGELARGLWGIELDNVLVGVISDLDLHLRWSGEEAFCDTVDEEEDSGEGSGEDSGGPPARRPYLQAAMNVVVYALTRPAGLAVQRARPAWEVQRPDLPPPGHLQTETWMATAAQDDEVLDVLGSSLALVHAPLGEPMRAGELQVRVDGGDTLGVVKSGVHGLLLHHLPVGPHRIQIQYRGRSRTIDITLKGGRVLTVGFRLRGLGFLTRLSITPLAAQVRAAAWGESFADLTMEEIYLETELGRDFGL